ncbi:hypothetical protein VTO42DRAFT_6961 [Malbranchea cinnamomea]
MKLIQQVEAMGKVKEGGSVGEYHSSRPANEGKSLFHDNKQRHDVFVNRQIDVYQLGVTIEATLEVITFYVELCCPMGEPSQALKLGVPRLKRQCCSFVQVILFVLINYPFFYLNTVPVDQIEMDKCQEPCRSL